MRLTIRKEVLASLLFIAVGGTFAIASLNHPMGTPASMGRGFFPFWVGLLLAVLGAWMLLGSLVAADRQRARLSLAPRPLAAIVASIIAFGVLLPVAGLYLTILVTALLASRADAGFGVLQAVILGLGLAVAAHLAFVLGIGLTLPLWPAILEP